MSSERIHRAVSADGTEIAGRVHGAGPPLVLLPAGPGDSEGCWKFLLPYLRDHFTCYLIDTRGRGLSENHPDHAPERLVEDVSAFLDSIGEPTGLVEWGTSLWALVAIRNPGAITWVAAYEPGVDELMSDEIGVGLEEVFGQVGSLIGEGRLTEAAQAFIDGSDVIYNDDEKVQSAAEFWLESAPNLPVFVQELGQAAESAGLSSDDPSVLRAVDVPVLLLHGTLSNPWFIDSVQYVAQYVPRPTVREIPGAPHFGPHLQPGAMAGEMIEFFRSLELSG